MFTSRAVLHTLIPCTLLILASFSSPGESRPRRPDRDTPEADVGDGHRVLLMEAVKRGILNSLGMDKAPRPSVKASEEELREMYGHYREKLREMAGNSSQETGETQHSTLVSTVLFPATVRPIKVLQRGQAQPGQHVQWYRAVFRRKPDIRADLTLARAELKISRQILDEPTEVNPEITVKVNRMKLKQIQTFKNPPVHVNTSSSQDLMLDVRPEVNEWMRSEGGRALVVDVRMVLDNNKGGLETNDPTISLEVGLAKPVAAARRTPRSNKEDECDERGWCCRKSVTVSFKDIGWADWVVAPAEYTMHFCDGSCPHNYKPASMHTQVKSRLYQITKGETPRPCCVPASYEPMVLMHYDSRGKLKMTPFNDLIVSKCHCA